MLRQYIEKVVENLDLSEEEAENAMKIIMSGNANEAQVAGFLAALRAKGESIDEITAFARVMREFAEKINPKVDGTLIDTCGTGGDKVKTINVSTISAIVAASSGAYVAKHGNRAVTSKSGSADILESLGVKIDISPKDTEKLIEKIGIGFLFSPIFHKAMKNVAKVRKDLGIRTVFNILGPLTNPASASAQLLGVFDKELTEKIANVLLKLGIERAMVVHGLEGLDEISVTTRTKVSELKNGKIETYYIEPEDFNIKKADIKEILAKDLEYNTIKALEVIKGIEKGAMRDIVLLNSGAAIYLAGVVKSIEDGVEMAKNAIEEGKAYEKLVELIRESGGSLDRLRKIEEKIV